MSFPRARLSVVLLAAATALGCGASSSSAERSPLSPSSDPAQWAAPFIGSSPTMVTVYRMHPSIRAEDIESAIFPRRSSADRVMVMAMKSCRQADDYDGALISVLHDVPRWLDPARPQQWTPTWAEAGFVFKGQSATGVRVYEPTSENLQGARLFVLPSSTWILATGVAAQRIGWALASQATEPPTLEALPGTMIEHTFRADDQRRQRLRQLRGGDRVIALGLTQYVRPEPRGGVTFLYGVKLVFADAASAHFAAEDAAKMLASSTSAFASMLGPDGSRLRDEPLFIERYGATVVLRPMPRH